MSTPNPRTMRASALGPASRTIAVSLVAVASLIACDRLSLPSQAWNGRRIAEPVAKPTVVWQRTDGSDYDVAQETAGLVTLLYFGYTHCPDICPLQLSQVGVALRRLGADTAAMVRVLVVSLDPARDTGSVLATWVTGFHESFVGLRGPAAEVAAEIARLGLAPEGDDAERIASPDPAHAAAIVAFARDGRGHFMYPASTNPEAWMYDLRKLLRDSVP